MRKIQYVEFSEGTYAALWSAVIKTGDENGKALFKEVVKREDTPVAHYVIAKDLLFGFLDDIRNANVPCDINMILKNCNKRGYYAKHY